MTLNELSQKAHEAAKRSGFYENPVETGTRLMLIVSELSEAMEADRCMADNKIRSRGLDSFDRAMNNRNPDSLYTEDEAFLIEFREHVKDSFGDEIADSLIRIFDMCGFMGINIDRHVELKMRYNSMREQKHGKKY